MQKKNVLIYLLTWIIIIGGWVVMLPIAMLAAGEFGLIFWLVAFVVIIAVLMLISEEILRDEDGV